jgi:hypothetical protein
MPFGLHKPIKEFTYDELLEKLESADMNSPVSNFIMAELTRRAIEKNADMSQELVVEINKFNKSSDKYSKKLLNLTWALLLLTIISVVALFIKH